MAKQPTEAQIDAEMRANQDANTLIAAKQIESDEKAHANVIKIIETRQQIATLVLKGR